MNSTRVALLFFIHFMVGTEFLGSATIVPTDPCGSVLREKRVALQVVCPEVLPP